MSKKTFQYKGEGMFSFKVVGYMKEVPSKVAKKFYTKQIKLALSNANIKCSKVKIEIYLED